MASTVNVDVAELVRYGATAVLSVAGFLLAQAYKKFSREFDAHGKALQALEVRVAVLETKAETGGGLG